MSTHDLLNLAIQSLPFLLKGALLTVFLSLIALFFGIIMALPLALCRYLKIPIFGHLGDAYVSIFRGTPLLVQLYLIYYGFPSLGIALGPIVSGALGLTLNVTAYLAESFRAALESIPAGQFEAAYSMGLRRYHVIIYVILPQSLRTALPTIGNTLVNLVKDTSLVSVITVAELLRASTLIIARTFQPLPLYIEAAVIYWIINYIFGLIQKRVEVASSKFMTDKK